MEWMIKPYVRYFEFNGRSRRLELWSWLGFITVIGSIISCIAVYGFGTSPFYSPAYWLFYAFNLIPSLSSGVRRLHDSGRSGWWIFITLLPIAGIIWLVVLYLLPSERGANRFGPDPLIGRGSGSRVVSDPLGSVSVLDQLSELAALRERGALTEVEFDRLKARLLADTPDVGLRGRGDANTSSASCRAKERELRADGQLDSPAAANAPAATLFLGDHRPSSRTFDCRIGRRGMVVVVDKRDGLSGSFAERAARNSRANRTANDAATWQTCRRLGGFLIVERPPFRPPAGKQVRRAVGKT